MQGRQDSDYLRDMLDASRQARKFVEGVSFEEFQQNVEKVFAVIRALQIIGEASRRIDLDNVWLPLERDLPPLEAGLTQMIADLEGSDDPR